MTACDRKIHLQTISFSPVTKQKFYKVQEIFSQHVTTRFMLLHHSEVQRQDVSRANIVKSKSSIHMHFYITLKPLQAVIHVINKAAGLHATVLFMCVIHNLVPRL